MGSRKFTTLCKFVVFLCVAISIYYLIAKCRSFDLDFKSKLADIKHIQAKLSKFLSNVMTRSNDEEGIGARNTQGKKELLNDLYRDNQNNVKELLNGSVIRSSLKTFVSLLEKHQKIEAEQRNSQFNTFMTKLTSVLQYVDQQRENNYDVRPEILHPQNPTTFPRTTEFLHDTNETSFRRKTTGKRDQMFQRITSTSSNNLFPSNTRRYSMQAILERRAKLFLDKMKTAGIQYTSNTFYYNPKKQPKPSAGIFYREVVPPVAKAPSTTVFLLHGEKYDSKLWLSIGTLFVLGTAGFRVIAVDLPGHGRSKNTPELPTSDERFRLLATMMLMLSPKGRRVLVTPGKSGIYSVPLVMTVPSTLSGVVFIAPNFTSMYPPWRYEKVTLPALVIFGDKDETTLHVLSLGNLEHLANKKIYSLPNARHDCYIDQPDAFHRLLKRFLGNVTMQPREESAYKLNKQKILI